MEHSFSSKLRYARKKLQLTQKEMAQMMDVSEKTISKWEKSKKEPILKYQGRLDEIFNKNKIIPNRIKEDEKYLPLKKITIAIDILRFIETNEPISAREISEEFSMSRRNIYRYLKVLKLQGLIKIYRGKYGGIETVK